MDEINKDNTHQPPQQDSKRPYPKLDKTITDLQERNQLVHKIVDEVDPEKLTPYYLEQLTKYLTETHENKKEKKILTNNRMVTVNKRETSYQGLVEKLENGEDGIYNFMTSGDKNILLVPKIEITENDIATIPGLKELRENIKIIQAKQKAARGKHKFLLTKQLIQMRQDQYILKSAYKPPIGLMKVTKNVNQINLNEKIIIDKNNDPISDCLVSLFDPHHICCLLLNYSKLKEDSYGEFDGDWWYLMQAFDQLVDKALKEQYPILYDIMIYKIDGMQNKDIAERIFKDHNIRYSVEYLSSLWRKKIPKIIAEFARKQWILWHFTFEERGQWKRCSRCHQVKLAHPYFFSRNKSAKDGYYSMCKDCRNHKTLIFREDKV